MKQKLPLLLYQMTDTPYSINVNTPYRRFDTSYPTGGYGISVIFMDTAYGSSQIHRVGNWSNALSCEVLALIRRISFVGYDHAALSVIDTKKTLELAEEIFCASKATVYRTVPISKPVSKIPPVQPKPVLNEIPRELSTIGLVKDSFNKMRNHVNDFENVVTVRTKVIGQNEGIHKESTDMKEVFTQMKTEAAKYSIERKTFEIKEKKLLLENDHLLELLIYQDLVHTAMNSLAKILDYQSMEKSFLDEYSKCVELKAELLKKNDMVEKAVYDELSKRYARIENICISLEIKVQQYKESFQNNQPQNKHDAPEFLTFFEINELKAQLKAKDNLISKLKDHIATLKGKCMSEGDKSKNTSKVIAPGMYKIDLEPFSPKPLRNKEAHVYYLKHTQENTDTLCEILEQARDLRPLDSDLDSACCSKHMTGQRSQLTNFVEKFMGNVRFGNDHVAMIMGYGDYPIGNVTISRIMEQSLSIKLCEATMKMSGLLAKLHLPELYNRMALLKGETALYSGPELQQLTPGYISSGLVQNPSSSTRNVPPFKKYWDILFQPLFDEYFQPSSSVVSPILLDVVPLPADTTGIPSTTNFVQDAPSVNTSSTTQEIQAPAIHQGVEEQTQGIQNV
ncbi:hypothetical protein Tco_1057536 [Tanacetum coccineum]|uniref:Integrase, catalytic region, zinc finger, CCHC-type, peptidase aspartic, catalytic n=1 Tax=Tanacetum coccineum TaxID=301880 RepID=A0ABQ5H6D7_9ASTR